MKFLQRLLGNSPKKQLKINSIEEFWNWFEDHQIRFHKILDTGNQIELSFINPVFNKLQDLNTDAYLLAGMKDSKTAEIVFTAEGSIKVFPFILELVAKAPNYDNWLFTALKPSLEIQDCEIRMGEVFFSSNNISFYPVVETDFPDEIAIKLLYTGDYDSEDQHKIENGCGIFVENWLGEVNVISQLDEIGFDHNGGAGKELVPIAKLKDYINWREKEFIDKYEDVFYDSENSSYGIAEWSLGDTTFVGKYNEELISWHAKASHPWMFVVEVFFDPEKNNGFPTRELMEEIHVLEDKISAVFVDAEGELELAQITGKGERKMFYACKDYHDPIIKLSRVLSSSSVSADFQVYRDKYWRSIGVFQNMKR